MIALWTPGLVAYSISKDRPFYIGSRIVVEKDRIAGVAKEIKGSVKEIIGKAVGDAKLQSDGRADKIEGKVQNAIGGLKDALKGR